MNLEEKKAKANELIAYHSPISRRLTEERTSLESRLIPVTAYIVVACVEAWYRFPEMMRQIDAALPAEEIGRGGRHPGTQVNTVYLWSIVNFWLLGRKIMTMVDPAAAHDPEPAHTVLDFWERAAMAFRGDDGTRQAEDAGGLVRVYDTRTIDALVAGVTPVDDERRAMLKRFNATLINYLFLLYFDTRVGSGDTGPYVLPDGRTLLVRDYYRLGRSDFPWSDVAADVPYSNLTAALVLDDVSVKITDFGTANTTPEDYLDRLVGFGLFTTDGGDLQPVPDEQIDVLLAAVRKAQAQLYRDIAAMDRDEKIRCGAYVYFSFLKPFADAAGIGDQLDWTVPRDTPEPLYQLLSATEGQNAGVPDEGDYYEPLP